MGEVQSSTTCTLFPRHSKNVSTSSRFMTTLAVFTRGCICSSSFFHRSRSIMREGSLDTSSAQGYDFTSVFKRARVAVSMIPVVGRRWVFWNDCKVFWVSVPKNPVSRIFKRCCKLFTSAPLIRSFKVRVKVWVTGHVTVCI